MPGDGARPVSRDGFYRGRFTLIQPKGWGHRAGLDPLLLAAAAPVELKGEAADLGAGAGALAFALACRCTGLRIRMVEMNPEMAALARHALALEANAALRGRLEVREGDVLGGRAAREAAGLADAGFDAVFTNPPFHPPGGRASPDAARQEAREAAEPGFLSRWVRASAALLRHGGLFACILRPEGIADLLAGAENRLGALTVLPVHSRAGQPAIRILATARRGSRAPLTMLPGIALEEADGTPSPVAQAVADGEAALFPAR